MSKGAGRRKGRNGNGFDGILKDNGFDSVVAVEKVVETVKGASKKVADTASSGLKTVRRTAKKVAAATVKATVGKKSAKKSGAKKTSAKKKAVAKKSRRR
jgi:type IV secretory pathway TrbL component